MAQPSAIHGFGWSKVLIASLCDFIDRSSSSCYNPPPMTPLRGAIVCNESHRIPIGYLLDDSFDGTDVSLGSRGKDTDKKRDKKEYVP
jgi:hypothetical protein